MITLPNVEEIRSVQSRSRQHLGQRLEYERARRFVGRDAELELFAARLATTRTRASEADLFSVLWVHGPGGIGKSSLLQAYARAARKAGFAVAHADGEGLLSSPAGIRAAATDSLADVIIIDAADRLGTAEDWLPDEFLPALPAKTVVAIASRRPPAAAWLSDPGWRNLLRVILLRNLSTEAVRALLDVERIPKVVLEQVMALTHGHPLAVSLLIDAIRRSVKGSEVPGALADLPDLVSALLQRLVDQAPSARHRAALQVSAHAPATTEPVLRAVLPASDDHEVAELWDWLRDLTFMEDTPAGVRPHDVARDILEADLRWRDPEAYADIHRRLRGYMIDNIRAQAGNPDGLQHAAADLLFLVRDHPVLGSYLDWDALGEGLRQRVTPKQADVIIAMTRAAQGDQQADLAAHWLRVQPEAFRLFRTPEGEVCGYAARLALHLARPEDIELDPGTAALWRYAQRHHPPRPGEQVLAWRFHVDRDPDEHHPRLSGTILGAWHIADMLLRPRAAWEFDAPYTDLAYWQPFLNHWDFFHVPEADYQIGDTRYVTFAHDWRRIGVAEWLERTAARELGEQVSVQPSEPVAALSQEEFAVSVKNALRSLHRPQQLLRNPLLASSMIQNALREDPDQRPNEILRSLIFESAQVLKSDPRAETQYRVLDRTYLHPAPSQEKAAELLDLPFSTYRRYRDRGVGAITEWLWDRDIDSTAQLN
jgi:hypothetical protein